MRMSDEKLKEALSGLTGHEPFVEAVSQILVDMLDDERDAAIQPNLSPENRAYNCGRTAAVLGICEYFENLGWKKALTSKELHPSDA
jgi:hypothetical protein